MTELRGERCVLRPWRTGDESSLVLHANNYNVWRSLADRFPHPYTAAVAEWWIANASTIERTGFAIEVEGEAAGGVGCLAKEDVRKFSGGLGYWLGEAFWGRGIVTEAVALFVAHVFDTTELVRLEADVYAPNVRSARVLEKNGFTLEGRHTRAVYKDGAFLDLLSYARLRE